MQLSFANLCRIKLKYDYKEIQIEGWCVYIKNCKVSKVLFFEASRFCFVWGTDKK